MHPIAEAIHRTKQPLWAIPCFQCIRAASSVGHCSTPRRLQCRQLLQDCPVFRVESPDWSNPLSAGRSNRRRCQAETSRVPICSVAVLRPSPGYKVFPEHRTRPLSQDIDFCVSVEILHHHIFGGKVFRPHFTEQAILRIRHADHSLFAPCYPLVGMLFQKK